MIESLADLHGDPFGSAPDANHTFQFAAFRQVVADLMLARESDRQGLALIEGPVGAGKTTLLITLAADQTLSSNCISLSGHEKLDPAHLLSLTAQTLGLPDPMDVVAPDDIDRLLARFSEALATRPQGEGCLLLLVDRAETLNEEVVKILIRLSALRQSGRKRLLPVLAIDSAGDDEPLPAALRKLERHVSFRSWLAPLSEEEVPAFMLRRLQVTGYHGDLPFSDDAMALIAEESRYLPGRVNDLGRECLALMTTELLSVVDAELAQQALKILHEEWAAIEAVRRPGDGAAVVRQFRPELGDSDDASARRSDASQMPPQTHGGWDIPLDDAEESQSDAETAQIDSKRRRLNWLPGKGIRPIRRRAIVMGGTLAGGIAAGFLAVVVLTSGPTPSVPLETTELTEGSVKVTSPSAQSGESLALAQSETEISVADPAEEAVETPADALLEELDAPLETAALPDPDEDRLLLDTQSTLAALDYDPGALDGKAGSKTAAAIRRYQADQGLKVTGREHQQLLEHMTAQKNLRDAIKLYHEGDYASAVETYDAVLARQPTDREALLFRGLARLRQGAMDGGVADLQQVLQPPVALARSAKLPAARFAPAQIYFIQERLLKLGFDPGAVDGHYGGETADAIVLYQQTIAPELVPQPGIPLLRHLEIMRLHYDGILNYRAARFDDALAHYGAVLSLAPDDAEAYFNRGLVRKKLGQTRLAIEDYNKALDLAPGTAKVHFDRANVLIHEGQILDAFSDYFSALASWVGIG